MMVEIARITERPSQDDLDAMHDLIVTLGEDSPLSEFLMDIWRRIYRGGEVVLYSTHRTGAGGGLDAVSPAEPTT